MFSIVFFDLFCSFFFFKQKTAYEMRISDWSSDVCSSDLDEPEQSIYRTLCRFYLEWPLQCKFQSCSTIFKKTNCRFRPCKTQPRDRRESQQNPEIGRASCRERVCHTCRSRWSPSHSKKNTSKT